MKNRFLILIFAVNLLIHVSNAQNSNGARTSIGIKLSGFVYQNTVLAYSAGLQVKRNDWLAISVGPLLKFATYSPTLGIDISSHLILNKCSGIKPIMELTYQYFSPNQVRYDTEHGGTLMTGFGLGGNLKNIDFQTTLGIAASALNPNNSIYYFKLSLAIDKLLAYKSNLNRKKKSHGIAPES